MLGGKNGPMERRHSHKFAAMGQDPALRIHIKKSPGKMLIPEIVPPSHSDGLLFTQCSPHSQHRAALGGIGRAALPASSSDQYGVSPMTKKERLWHTYLNMIKNIRKWWLFSLTAEFAAQHPEVDSMPFRYIQGSCPGAMGSEDPSPSPTVSQWEDVPENQLRSISGQPIWKYLDYFHRLCMCVYVYTCRCLCIYTNIHIYLYT